MAKSQKEQGQADEALKELTGNYCVTGDCSIQMIVDQPTNLAFISWTLDKEAQPIF